VKSRVFRDQIEHILNIEGGFTNDPVDRGGATKYGITLNFYKNNVDSNATVDDIRNLTKSEAKEIYYEHFWKNASKTTSDVTYDDLPEPVASVTFNFGINMGSDRGHTLLQKAINASGGNVSVDGWLGPETVRASTHLDTSEIVKRYGVEVSMFYYQIVKNDSSQEKFLEGWFYRVSDGVLKAITG